MILAKEQERNRRLVRKGSARQQVSQEGSMQIDLHGLTECKHYDGDMCYYWLTHKTELSYPKEARVFKCPEKNKRGRQGCRLISLKE